MPRNRTAGLKFQLICYPSELHLYWLVRQSRYSLPERGERGTASAGIAQCTQRQHKCHSFGLASPRYGAICHFRGQLEEGELGKVSRFMNASPGTFHAGESIECDRESAILRQVKHVSVAKV